MTDAAEGQEGADDAPVEPVVVAPPTATARAATAGAETPGAETPGAETPGAETPAAEMPATEPSPEAERTPMVLTEAALEALLFVAERPLSRREIATLAGTDRATVDARLGDLEVSLRSRGIRLLIDGDCVEFATAPDGGALVARYVGADAVRLSPASLETLAIVAYRQPVTKAAVERIRGVDSEYTIRTLLHRRLVVELGRSGAPGRPYLYGTGFEFLERFGLTSLDELPFLDVDVAARLGEEGGDAVTQPMFRDADLVPGGEQAGPGAAPGPRRSSGAPGPVDPADPRLAEPDQRPTDPAARPASESN